MDNLAYKERRRFSRIPFEAVVSIDSADGHWMGKLIDISLKGLLISRPPHWTKQVGDRAMLEVCPPETNYCIRMEVSVAHMEPNQVGFECHHIDLDSISHLRRLVELNIGDETVLNRELAEMIH